MKTLCHIRSLIFVFALLTLSVDARAQQFGDILTVGDSLTAGLAGSPQGVLTCAALGGIVIARNNQRSCRGNGNEGVGGWQPNLKALAGSQIFNYGNSGEQTGEMVARLPSHLGFRSSQFVLIMGGTNDMIFGGSVSVAIANLSNMVQQSLNAGRIPIVSTLPPLSGSRYASTNNRIIQLNQAILQLPNQYQGLVIADVYAAVAPSWSTLNSGDNIHFGVNGNAVVATVWFDAMQKALKANAAAMMAPIIQLLLDD